MRCPRALNQPRTLGMLNLYLWYTYILYTYAYVNIYVYIIYIYSIYLFGVTCCRQSSALPSRTWLATRRRCAISMLTIYIIYIYIYVYVYIYVYGIYICYISVRVNLLPAELCAALAHLTSHAPSVWYIYTNHIHYMYICICIHTYLHLF